MPRGTDPYAGRYMRLATRSRATGTTVEMFDTAFDADHVWEDGPQYVLLCLDHQQNTRVAKRSEAHARQPKPMEWCTDCQAIVAGSADKVVGEKRTRSASGQPRKRRGAMRHVSTYVPPPLPDKPVDQMSRSELMRVGVCFKCRGSLRHPVDGHYHETSFPVNAVCCVCVGLDVAHERRKMA